MMNKEMYEDFLSDHLEDLKKEFKDIYSSDIEVDFDCLDYLDYSLEQDFEKYCKNQFEEYMEEIRYKYSDRGIRS